MTTNYRLLTFWKFYRLLATESWQEKIPAADYRTKFFIPCPALLERPFLSFAICVKKEGIFWLKSGANGNFGHFIIFFQIYSEFFCLFTTSWPGCDEMAPQPSLSFSVSPCISLHRARLPCVIMHFFMQGHVAVANSSNFIMVFVIYGCFYCKNRRFAK